MRINIKKLKDNLKLEDYEALIESLEGKRGHPRLKPHGKECEWFFDNPATVNNVETIASVPNIVENGAEGYTKYGTASSPRK